MLRNTPVLSFFLFNSFRQRRYRTLKTEGLRERRVRSFRTAGGPTRARDRCGMVPGYHNRSRHTARASKRTRSRVLVVETHGVAQPPARAPRSQYTSCTCAPRCARAHTLPARIGRTRRRVWARRRRRRSTRRVAASRAHVAASRARRRARGPPPRPMCCPWLALKRGAATKAKRRRAAACFEEHTRELDPCLRAIVERALLPITSKAGTTLPRVAPLQPPDGAHAESRCGPDLENCGPITPLARVFRLENPARACFDSRIRARERNRISIF